MIYLGLSNIYGHETSACLVENNKIVAMAEEETGWDRIFG